jgi:hypothetical protein
MAVGVDIRAFRAAVERDGHRPIVDAMAADVVFHTPVASEALEGRTIVEWVLTAVFQTYDRFHYTEQFETADKLALLYRASIGQHELEGMEIFRFGPDHLIHEMTVMIRPHTAAAMMDEAVNARLADGAPPPSP